MTRDAPAPLFYPFETGDLHWPASDASVLFLGARAEMRPPAGFGAKLHCVQGFRPDYLALQRTGADVSPTASGDSYDLALVVAGRHRGQNEAWLGEAIERVGPGGLMVVAGGKTDGISSLRKRLAKDAVLGGHLAKNHGEVFWLAQSAEAVAWAKTARFEEGVPLIDGRFQTAAGMFSHDRVDQGSLLLEDNLPANLKGEAADFCAGWGYLSVALAERATDIRRIDLYEADHASLEAAKANMGSLAHDMPAAFHWLDLAREPVERRYDVVVMNPPFHHGRAAEPDVGLAMIRAAAKALKAGGQLFMVANRGLPYEPALKAAFREAEPIAEDKTFRVWRARR
jgi:16S rRNA (guanine1207-N2)-methyltransferase